MNKKAAKKVTKKSVSKKASPKKAASKKAAPKKAAAAKSATKKVSKKNTSVKTNTKKPALDAVTANKFFNVTFLKAQKALLIEERAQYTASADRLQAEAAQLAADREPGDVTFDEESGEGDTIAVERARDLSLSAKARENVAEIDDALKRIALGTYGICEASKEPIPKERLEFIPHTRVRVEYKAARLGSW